MGTWLILSDIHVPHHHDETIALAFEEAKRKDVDGILLNGDIMDCGSISRHAKHHSSVKYSDELALANIFLDNIGRDFPGVPVVYKKGNHEERLDSYIMSNAPELEGVEGLTLESFLKLEKRGIQCISNGRVIQFGRLSVLHGHEYRGGGGINPARWLELRAGGVSTLCGHFHRTQDRVKRNLRGKYHGYWTTGCACNLHPHYAMENEWNLGCAFVHLSADGNFEVTNLKNINGVMK